jgi:hypothetical protein
VLEELDRRVRLHLQQIDVLLAPPDERARQASPDERDGRVGSDEGELPLG